MTKIELKTLISNGKIESAIDFLRKQFENDNDIVNEILLLSSQYQELTKNKKLKLPFDKEEFERIKISFFYIIDKVHFELIEKKDLTSSEEKSSDLNNNEKVSENNSENKNGSFFKRCFEIKKWKIKFVIYPPFIKIEQDIEVKCNSINVILSGLFYILVFLFVAKITNTDKIFYRFSNYKWRGIWEVSTGDTLEIKLKNLIFSDSIYGKLNNKINFNGIIKSDTLVFKKCTDYNQECIYSKLEFWIEIQKNKKIMYRGTYYTLENKSNKFNLIKKIE